MGTILLCDVLNVLCGKAKGSRSGDAGAGEEAFGQGHHGVERGRLVMMRLRGGEDARVEDFVGGTQSQGDCGGGNDGGNGSDILMGGEINAINSRNLESGRITDRRLSTHGHCFCHHSRIYRSCTRRYLQRSSER